MDVVLLALSLLSLALTFNALWPRYAPPRRAVLSFALGFLVIETPVHQILGQAVVVVLLLNARAAGTAMGLVAVGLFLLSWAGLVVVASRSRLAVPAVARGLMELRTGMSHEESLPLAEWKPDSRTAIPDGAKARSPEAGAETQPSTEQAAGPTGSTDPVPAPRYADTPTQGLEAAGGSRRVLANLDPSNLPPSRWWWPRLPVPIKPRTVRRHGGIVFATVDGLRLKLDVYHPNKGVERAPVLMYVHGGAWILGTRKEQGLPLIHRMARAGWVVVAVDYRLSPRATFPDHLVDLKRAMAWIRDHIADYGGDPSFVAVAGNSAGGHLAALFALTPHDKRYQPGFEAVDTSVMACVPYYGIHDFTDRFGHWPHRGMRTLLKYKVMKADPDTARARFEEASPMSRVGPDAPPFLLVHGDHDTLAPVAESRRFQEVYRAACNAPIGFIEVPGAQHAFEIFPSAREAVVNAGVQRFLEAVRAQAGEEPGNTAASG